MTHMKIVRAPHASARVLSVDAAAARAMPGVIAVLTHEDVADTTILDPVIRFAGQRVAAVVAETEAVAKAACRAITVEYDVHDPVTDPHAALSPDSPKVHETADSNIVAELHGSTGDVDTGLTFAFTVHDATYTQDVRPVPPDGRECTGWLDDDARLILRTAAPSPARIGDALATLHDLPRAHVHVLGEASGPGGPGILTEDIVALAVLKTRRPVTLKGSGPERTEGTAECNPIEVRVRLGASHGGRLTAMDLRVVCNVGAYGGHAAGALMRAVGESVAPYKCRSKRIDGYAVRTNTPAPGTFFDDWVAKADFAVERAMDDLVDKLGLDPVAFRRMNAIGPADPAISADGSHVRAGGGVLTDGRNESG